MGFKFHAKAHSMQRRNSNSLSALTLAPWRLSRYFRGALRAIKFSLLLLCSTQLHAQVYPVNGNAALIPPYSIYLADYTSRATERLMVNVVLNDVTRPELRVRLRVRIESQNIRIETKPEYIGSEIILQGGVPLRLSGTDLIEYFNPNNLNFSGITRREFEKTGALPQGFYQFCFEVLEYNRGVKISNTICAPAWLILNDPPIVNLPRNGEKLKPTVPQNLIFQWTPRHTGSPNSAFSTEYDIEMVEIWPANRNPNDAILSSPRILETTTRSTTFIYGPAETSLELGRQYALRIKAKSIVGVEEFDLFKNNGYSEVISFVYGDACDMPLYVSAQAINPSRIKVQWQGQFNHTEYSVRYRQAGDPNAAWFTSNTFINEAEISSLKANTTYEYQVAGGCGIFESTFTPVATVATKPYPVADYSCGLPIATFNLDPTALIASLKVGDVIQAGDFEVQLTKVTGSNGSFSGEGVVAVPFLNNVKVKTVFNGIMVNTENRMVNGYMNVTGAAMDIIPDEVTAMMDELTQALDKIDEGLDKAEDVLNDVEAALDIANKVIEEVKEYLPDDILQQINDAKNEIAAARDAMKTANTPEEKEAAQAELKAARKKLADAAGNALEYYAQAIKDLVKFLKNSFTKLGREKKDSTATTERDIAEMEKLLSEKYLELQKENLDGLTVDASSQSTEEVILLEEFTTSREEYAALIAHETTGPIIQNLPRWESFKKKLLVLIKVAAFCDKMINDSSALEDLVSKLKKDSESFIKEFAERRKNKASDEELQRLCDQFLSSQINNIVQ